LYKGKLLVPRLIRAKERRRAGNMYCSFCRPDKVKALWRKRGFADPLNSYACEEHKHLIKDEDDNRITLADEMTWRNL
jgi:hypothetical protein